MPKHRPGPWPRNVSGPRIRIAREQFEWSLEDIAARLQLRGIDVSPRLVGLWETQESPVYDHVLVALSRVLAKPMTWLVGEE